MSTKVRTRIAKSNEDALAAFVSRKAEIDTMLARLQALSDDHFGYRPDETTWSHVGTLGYYAELLKRITDQAFNEGEHAQLRRDLRTRPARLWPPGLGVVGGRWCSPTTEIIP